VGVRAGSKVLSAVAKVDEYLDAGRAKASARVANDTAVRTPSPMTSELHIGQSLRLVRGRQADLADGVESDDDAVGIGNLDIPAKVPFGGRAVIDA
jgi:hypothetical protein